MGHAAEFTDAGFQSDVLESDVPVLVDFWAPWCAPCRQIAPLIDKLAQKYAGTAKIGKVNVDENPGVAQQYGINTIPTLLVFRNGQLTETFVGFPPEAKIDAALMG
jgi:thioredoxin 1